MNNNNLKKYGKFNTDGTEFVITTPNTPRPWINYLTNEEYCAIISQCAGGYSFYKDCRTDRILRWAPENWHFDRPGRYIYIRDRKSKKYWSATYQPIRSQPQFYQCIHGLGYTIIESINNNIKTKVSYFVPTEETCEIWLVEITNLSKVKTELQLFPYVELLIGDYHMELRYRNIMTLYNRVFYSPEMQLILGKKTAFWGDMNIQPFPYLIFFASSLPVDGYCTKKDIFLGKYNTEEQPEVVIKGKMNNFAFCSGEDCIASLYHEITLKPKETKEFVIILGQTENKNKKVAQIVEKYRNISNAKLELEKTKSLWRKRILDNIIIETPDENFNRIINIWVKYQLYICNYWSRSPSYYHEGSGGRGYRDSCQDAEGICSINNEHTKKKILSLAKLIRKDGTCAPGWSDTRGPATYRPNKDHPVWLVYTVSSYIKETGDIEILNVKLPYLKDRWINGWEINPKWNKGSIYVSEGTLFDHLWKNLEFTYNDIDESGLPRIGHADWNDAIDAAGIKHKGGSVMLAEQLVRSMKILAELADIINKKKEANELRKRAKIMSDRINQYYWDGDWYQRGITDDGYIYGSKKNKEGKIFLNAQSWAILAGIPLEERIKRIIRSVNKYLNGEHGYALFYPAYTKWDPRLGRISMFSEGTKENAAIFCHACAFWIAALISVGKGTEAYESMKKIFPNLQNDYDLYKTEPYVFAEYLVGPEHPYLYGEGAFTWITGTAGWIFQIATELMLGAKRDYNGLLIDPCIPKYWKKVKIKRPFRGDIYDITIENPAGVEKGIEEIYLDGKKIQSNLIKPIGDGKIHYIQVILGRRKKTSTS
ncbi:MAG: GH36-type glycosyl hydrolase domain-containing protein [Endomicrobiia bacterium]